jgi:hypothetical protein
MFRLSRLESRYPSIRAIPLWILKPRGRVGHTSHRQALQVVVKALRLFGIWKKDTLEERSQNFGTRK